MEKICFRIFTQYFVKKKHKTCYLNLRFLVITFHINGPFVKKALHITVCILGRLHTKNIANYLCILEEWVRRRLASASSWSSVPTVRCSTCCVRGRRSRPRSWSPGPSRSPWAWATFTITRSFTEILKVQSKFFMFVQIFVN